MIGKQVGRRLLVLMLMLALMAGAALWAFRHVGRWLVDPDSLDHARAIVVLSGKVPFRAMEAAEIYRQGWAPEVWLFEDQTDAADEACARIGIHRITEQEYDRMVLERLGVPKEAIRNLETPTTNTLSEIKLIADELRRAGGDKVILVTSPMHTRRSKAIWRVAVGDHPQAILCYGSAEPSDPDHWWRATQDVESVTHELLGLVNASLGFVAKPGM